MSNSRKLHCTFGLQQFRAAAAALLVSTLLGIVAPPVAGAATITLGFEATVFNSRPSNIDSGLDIAAGDTIQGQFTFEPVSAEGPEPLLVFQPYSAWLSIDGHQLRTSTSSGETVFRVKNDNVLIGFGPFRIDLDEIEVFSVVEPADSSTLELGLSTFRMFLWGNVSTIDTPELPTDVDVWNAFDSFLDPLRPNFDTTRSLQMSIRGASGDTSFFSALIGDFVVVPEPTYGWAGLLMCTLAVRRVQYSVD